METLIAFVAGLFGASVGLYLYHKGKETGRYEQDAASNLHLEALKILRDTLPAKFADEKNNDNPQN